MRMNIRYILNHSQITVNEEGGAKAKTEVLLLFRILREIANMRVLIYTLQI